jgi:hypothetical protein
VAVGSPVRKAMNDGVIHGEIVFALMWSPQNDQNHQCTTVAIYCSQLDWKQPVNRMIKPTEPTLQAGSGELGVPSHRCPGRSS